MPPEGLSERLLILAPTGRDAELTRTALASGGLVAEDCPDIASLSASIVEGGGAVLITEEALTPRSMGSLRETLEQQPAWSDMPVLIFTSRPSTDVAVRSFEQLGERANITLIERPIRVKTLVSAAKAALRARRRQYEIRDLVCELERRVSERDQFLAMLSHELRNPLAAISLAVDSLGEDDTVSNEHAILTRQTRHLAKLVDDLLDIARVTSGKISLHLVPVDLCDLAEHCMEMMRPRADARRIRLSIHHTTEQVRVKGDAVRLEQIVNNLLANAIKYTPPGGQVSLFVEADGDDSVIRVQDSGKGIAPEMLSRVFEMFMQGETTIDRSEGGMGVGLTLVKKLVTQHRGSVHAHSAGRGCGSEFVVRIPLLPAETQASAALPKTDHAQTLPRRIVVIEDNADVRDLLRIKLRQLGHEVEAAEDGTKGLEKLLSTAPEVALVDIGLPGLDGYEIARRTRESLGSGIYLIALTGYGQAEDRDRAIEAGFDVHLTKPADFASLQRLLSQLGERRERDRDAV